MSEQEDIRKLLQNYERRLQALEERKALLGLDAPVSLAIEIDDIKTKILELQNELTALEGRVDNKIGGLTGRVAALEEKGRSGRTFVPGRANYSFIYCS